VINLDEKIAAIEKEIRETPYHKGTEHHIGRLKARLAKLKARAEESHKRGGFGFALKKSGDATVVLIGPPSVGKSTLLNKLANTNSRVEPWPFSTVKVIPGMLDYNGAKIQIFDLPGIIGGAAKGIGRGREVLAAARAADLILLMLDIKTRGRLESLLKEIAQAGLTTPILVVVNKIDTAENLPKVAGAVLISAEKGVGLEGLKEKIWAKLGLIRVYLKPKDGQPDFAKPLILRAGAKVSQAGAEIFPEAEEFKKIILSGPSALFPNQEVSLTHELKDGDILTFVLPS
jgi:small GTP-binding protein